MSIVLYITNGLSGSGGLERVLSVKASYLAENYSYDVHITTLNEKNKNPFYCLSSKINIHTISVSGGFIKYIYQYIVGIRKVIKELNPDLISVCDDGLKGMMFPLIFLGKQPVIYERHVSRQIEIKGDKTTILTRISTLLKFKLMNFAGGKFDRFIVLTKGNTLEWQLNNMEIIPNPLPQFSREKSPLSSKTAIAVGKQSYQKGYDRLLEIWKLVHEKYPDWKLEVYGKLDPSLGLETRAEELGIANIMHFHTPIKSIHEKYFEASMLLMTSRYEGFGLVLIEAMSFGVPCISFDCPFGPGDIISDQQNGLLIENGNTEAFADAVIKIIENKEYREQMGARAYDSIDGYRIETIGDMWDDLFKRLLEEN
jgi:glycosyltransferase involved in cell wall biosynthesis